jgi:hypothetical protein
MNRICESCGTNEMSETSDEAMLAEALILFPNIQEEYKVIVCDDCFKKIMDYNEPGQKRYE